MVGGNEWACLVHMWSVPSTDPLVPVLQKKHSVPRGESTPKGLETWRGREPGQSIRRAKKLENQSGEKGGPLKA